MLQYHIGKFESDFCMFKHVVQGLREWKKESPAGLIPLETRKLLSKLLSEGMQVQCKALELTEAKTLIANLIYILEQDHDQNYSERYCEYEILEQRIEDEMKAKTFVLIPTAKAHFFEKDGLFGFEVERVFPSASPEIKAAGNCMAADLNTAAVFHLMRVAEIGLHELAKLLKVEHLKNNETPVEYGMMGEVIGALDQKKKSIGRPINREQEESLELYSRFIMDCSTIKDLWRNPVSHSGTVYDAAEALRVFEHVADLMRRLATERSKGSSGVAFGCA